MAYYVCIGKNNFYATLDKPVYHEAFENTTFIDYMDWMVGYAKTPPELGIKVPFPKYMTDKDLRIWAIQKGPKPDNHQFFRTKEIRWQNQTVYKPRTKEKYQDPNPKWGSTETPALWKQFKKEGKL